MYENKILRTEAPIASEKQLDEFGKDGWELVTIILWDRSWYYYFKRTKMSA